jgi:hypothetical protein
MAVKESAIVSAAIQWLYRQGLQPIRNNTGGFSKSYTSKKTNITKTHHIRVGKKGSGDILVCNKFGRWIELEAKTETGEQSDDQKARQAHVEACGGVYILFRSIDELEAQKVAILSSYAARYADNSLIPRGKL